VSSSLALVLGLGGQGARLAMKKQSALSLVQPRGSGLAVGSILWLGVTLPNGMHFSPSFIPSMFFPHQLEATSWF